MNTKEVKTTSLQSSSTTDPDTVFRDEGSGKPQKSSHPVSGAIIAAMVGVLLLGALGGFVAGAQVGKASSATASQQGGPGGQMGGPGSMNGTFGEVTSVSSTSVTVKDQRSSESTTYTINDDTKVTDSGDTASVSDINEGDTVMIEVSDSDDATASVVRLNPSMGGPGKQMNAGSSGSNDTTSRN